MIAALMICPTFAFVLAGTTSNAGCVFDFAQRHTPRQTGALGNYQAVFPSIKQDLPNIHIVSDFQNMIRRLRSPGAQNAPRYPLN